MSDEKQKNDPAHVKAVLLQLQASDAPGSDLNIMTIAPRRALEFMKQSSHGG